MSRKAEKPKPVSVYVRCRPRNDAEKAQGSPNIVECTKKGITIKHGHQHAKTYSYDHVYGPMSTQPDVYKGVAASTVEEVLQGYNCTIFAYGQTGTGKTYTMEGNRSVDSSIPWDKDPKLGIIPRTMSHMFDRLNSQASDYSVRVSMLEMYNEELFDLLSVKDHAAKLRLFDDSARKGSVVIQGLEEVQVTSKDEVYNLMERAMTKRKTAETLLNAHSSRSHVVFTVTVHIKTINTDDPDLAEEEVFKMGKLNLVDLAGSENIGRSGAQNARAREAGNINQSLLTLGRVITALVDRAPHIPYRESKLTRLLQDSLGGRTQTSIIATISPALVNYEETLSTLEYAHRAKNILNKPEINQRATKRTLVKEYTAEIERLKRELQNGREKTGVYLDYDNYKDMECRIKSQSQLITDKEAELAGLLEARGKVTTLFSASIKQIDGLHQKLDRKETVEEQNNKLFQDMSNETSGALSMLNKMISEREDGIQALCKVEESAIQSSTSNENELYRKGQESLDALMRTVVQGLNTAVQQRDNQQGDWLVEYFTSQLLPAVTNTIESSHSFRAQAQSTQQLVTDAVKQSKAEMSEMLKALKSRVEYIKKTHMEESKALMDLVTAQEELLKNVRTEQSKLIHNKTQDTSHKVQLVLDQTREMLRQSSEQITQIIETDGAQLREIPDQGCEQVQYSAQEVKHNIEERCSTMKFGLDALTTGHCDILNDHMEQNLENINSQSAAASAVLEHQIGKLAESCNTLQNSAKVLCPAFKQGCADSSTSLQALHSTIVQQTNQPQPPHVQAIRDQYKQCHTIAAELQQSRATSNINVQQQFSHVYQSSHDTSIYSTSMIDKLQTQVIEFSNKLKQDMPTGQTPKRAKLNRLKLHQNSGFNLDVIESDEENQDPSPNPVLEMSFT